MNPASDASLWPPAFMPATPRARPWDVRERYFPQTSCLGPNCADPHSLRARLRLSRGIRVQDGLYCSTECLEAGIQQMAQRLLPIAATRRTARPHRFPLGLLLLSRGEITAQQLRDAVEAQQQHGKGRIGEWLIQQGAAREEQITSAVALQWARPIFPLAKSTSWRSCRGWLPMAMLESLRMIPLHYTAREQRLFIGFAQTIDAQALAAITLVTGCRTEPCIVSDSALEAALNEMRATPTMGANLDIRFAGVRNPVELAKTVCDFTRRTNTTRIRAAAVSNQLWFRMQGSSVAHLVFG